MGYRWAMAPAALGVAAAVGIAGAAGGAAASAAVGPAPGAVATDRQGWSWQPGGSVDGWAPRYGSGSEIGATGTEALSSTAAAAAAEITPSVVNIDTVMDYGSAEAAGTGIVIGSDGIVLTNHHVVEGATAITGTVVGTGKTYPAVVLGYDPETDVAVIDLTGASKLPVATLGNADELQIGELVVGVGNAGGAGGEPTSVAGQVTALGQTITATDAAGGNPETLDNLIGTDADIQAGQSGGPLVDAEGDVVGVDVAASTGYTGSAARGYAIPIDDATAIARQILAGQEPGTVHVGATPFLGVQLAAQPAVSATPWGYPGGRGYRDGLGSASDSGAVEGASATTGVAIAGVVPGSAAEQVGLAAGDSITTLNGTAVTTAEQLSSLIASADVGSQLSITWTDAAAGNAHTGTVTLGAGPVG
jgi:S1-C subfamily serine protease